MEKIAVTPLPQFKNQFNGRKRIQCNVGSPVKIKYAGHYDEKGRVVVEEIGRENLYDSIQSHAESVDIHVLLKRFANGDASALSQRQGFFADVTEFPQTYAEALNHMMDMEREFNKLPTEIKEKFGNSFNEFIAASGSEEFYDKLGIPAPAQTAPAQTAPAETIPEGGSVE